MKLMGLEEGTVIDVWMGDRVIGHRFKELGEFCFVMGRLIKHLKLRKGQIGVRMGEGGVEVDIRKEGRYGDWIELIVDLKRSYRHYSKEVRKVGVVFELTKGEEERKGYETLIGYCWGNNGKRYEQQYGIDLGVFLGDRECYLGVGSRKNITRLKDELYVIKLR